MHACFSVAWVHGKQHKLQWVPDEEVFNSLVAFTAAPSVWSLEALCAGSWAGIPMVGL